MLDSRLTQAVWRMAILAGTVGLSAGRAGAATVTNSYTGPATGDYNVAGNWSQARVPGTSGSDADNAVISGSSVSLDDDVSAVANLNNVTANNGATLHVSAGGFLKITGPTNAWSDGWLKLGVGGTGGNLVVDGGTVTARMLEFAGDSTFTMNGGTVNSTARAVIFGETANKTFTADLKSGTINLNQTYGFHVADNGTATITQDGATVYANGVPGSATAEQVIGQFSGADGTWNLKSGVLYAGMVQLGNYAGASGTINQTGGASHFTSNLFVGGNHQDNSASGGSGAYVISGGTFDTPNTSPGTTGGFGYGDGMRSLEIGNHGGSGLFKIVGNDATINVNRYAKSTLNLLTLGASGTLEYDIDDSTVSIITVAGAGAAANYKQNATLGGVIDLNLINGYSPAYGTTYDLLSAGTIFDNGYTLAAGDAGAWSLAITGTAGQGQLLQATYLVVPEPASLGLVMLGGAALLARKRKV